MDGDLNLFDGGEFVMAEFECDAELLVDRSCELEQGATVLVANESDGVFNYEDLSQFFGITNGIQMETEDAVERTLADPDLKQILQEADDKVDFDPEAEREKLRDFLQVPTATLKQPVSIIKCSNCNGLFHSVAFQEHRCEVNAKPAVAAATPKQPPVANIEKPVQPKKLPSERILIENQVRIRRYIKEELKYDLETGVDSSKVKKSASKGPNECNICDRKFVHASGLVRHMEKHALDLIPTQSNAPHSALSALGLLVVLECTKCGRVFYDVKIALEHISVHYPLLPKAKKSTTVQETEADLKRQLSALSVEGNQLLAVSMQLDKLQRYEHELFSSLILSHVLQCEFCDYIFADVKLMLKHEATHLPERRFECFACSLVMTTAKEASVHYQTDCVYMREGLKQLQMCPNRYFVCNVCELKFANVELLQEHRYSAYHYYPRLSESGKRMILPCDFCASNFEYAHEIQPHYEEKHLNKKKREKELRNNSGNAGGNAAVGRLRQYLCDICGKSYTQSSHLWQHLRFHQGVKPFVCDEPGCGRKFTIRPDLNDHTRKCHTGERPYHCLVCGKRFLTGSVFYQHRLIHRGERRYECDECGKRFYRADALKNHQRIHTGEKPYDCQYCTKTFRQRGDRDKHVRARHSHLDENARLMMRMQKLELETAAALKAKQMQEGSRDGEFLTDGSTLTSGMLADQQYDMVELDPNDFCDAAEFEQVEIATDNTDYEVISYEPEAIETVEVPQFAKKNARVVVVENNAAQPFYF
ncbi:testis-specific zinc finger protein topi [Drosophila albomicans]|uniref:Testis-specific zinc finger protein topi n=1 Tax=Drosophila albomicans TaxID=7291 RepID=A0A9C6T085_DROAB|nr:testis-specific zinc finger protein topi [Drosophila albomicans]